MQFNPFLQCIVVSFVTLMKLRQKRVEVVLQYTISTLTLFSFSLVISLQSQLQSFQPILLVHNNGEFRLK